MTTTNQEPVLCTCEFQPQMIEIGGIGKDIQIVRQKSPDVPGVEVVGVREMKLYQCPTCKTVKLQ
jgi:hypothetical protein